MPSTSYGVRGLSRLLKYPGLRVGNMLESNLKMNFSEKPKRKLSALRGKLTKQSKKEIDDQISNLRSEWDRNF